MNACFDHGRERDAGAASAAPAWDTTLPLTTFAAANLHTGLTIRGFRPLADADALRETAACEDLFNRVLNSEAGRPYLFRFGPVDLWERNAHLISVRDGARVVGTMHFHRDQPGRTIFRGAVVDPAYSGQRICSAMGAHGLLHDFVANGDAEEVHCAVRVVNGMPNEGSRVSFSRLGFLLETDCGATYLDGSFRSRHLFESAERDEFGNAFIRYRRMTAGPDVIPRARAFLAAWSQALLPFPTTSLSS
ncbi:hypothetical protein [Nitratireductor alexandrii]|uniref:hypothetical protein n=1 Tax=Nitratireductor alexandrii TaxID=2448161 RepID=UPI000FDC4C6C|nr:hypothetical protein [Nitratireductor alexandrii]